MTKIVSSNCATADTLPVTAGWSREKSRAREEQGKDSSSRNVSFQNIFWIVSRATGISGGFFYEV
jgi:hypothetical protein